MWKRARSPQQLADDPVGAYWLADTQLVWCADARTCGSLHWGTPSERDARDLTHALGLARHPALASGFEVFMDASAIERVEWPAFSHLLGYVREQLPQWGTRIRHQAVVVPDGPIGALLAGMVPLIGMTYPLRFFATTADALGWLAWPRDPAEELAADMRGVAPVVQQLRRWLDGALTTPSLQDAASNLGRSPRSLQRELKGACTSFTAEVNGARVRAATAMLESSDDKVEVIARAVGCASASKLSSLFRRYVGVTPGRYRGLGR